MFLLLQARSQTLECSQKCVYGMVNCLYDALAWLFGVMTKGKAEVYS